MTTEKRAKTSGPAVAAILSACFGCFIFSLAIVLAVISKDNKETLDWWSPAGPLSGKAGVGVVAWLVSWFILHLLWRWKEPNLKLVLVVSFILLALGFLGSFPPFYEAFEH